MVIACVVAAALNFTIEKVAYRPLRNSPRAGAADHRHRHVDPAADAGHDHLEAQLQALSHPAARTPFRVGGAVITPTQIMILGVTAVSLAVLMYLVNYTKLGRAMRATAENPRVAGLMGVKPDMVISATFIIGAMLAAIAGMMYASNYGTVQHTMGFLPGLKAFTAACLAASATWPARWWAASCWA
jgi:branched-chain amino acid transport system permease protein